MTYIAAITEIIQSVSVIFAALVAMFSFDAWRREHVGRRKMDLAEEVLALFYQARDAIRMVRSPFGWKGEGETRKADADETPDEKVALDQAYVVVERYNKHVEMFSRLQTLRYRFMAQVGLEEAKPFDDLNRVIGDIFLAARRRGRHLKREDRDFRSEEERDRHFKEVRKAESILWEGDEDPDPIVEKVDALLANIEKTCKGILTSKDTLFGFINLPLRKRKGSH